MKQEARFGAFFLVVLLLFAVLFRFADQVSVLPFMTGSEITESVPLIDRAGYEDQIQFPPEEQDALKDHLNVVMPLLVLCGVFAIVLIKFGSDFFFHSLLYSFLFFGALLLIITACLEPVQCLIIILPVFSSYMISVAIRKWEAVSDRIQTVFILTCAQVVLATEVFSLFKAIHPSSYLTVFLLSTVLLYKFTGFQPKTVFVEVDYFRQGLERLLSLLKSNKVASLLASVVLLSVLWRCIQIVLWPLNNSDSMHYHLARVAYWLQNQSLEHFSTENARQIAFPFNGEILFLWTMVSSRLDVLCGFIQMSAYMLTGVLLYQCMNVYLKAKQLFSLVATLIWLSLPVVVLVSTTTQNELIVAYFSLYVLFKFLIGPRDNIFNIVLIGMSLGLAIGTKTTGIMFMLPLMALAITLAVTEVIRWRLLFRYVISSLCGFVLFGAYSYIQNFIYFGNIFGREGLVAQHLARPSIVGFFSTSAQYIYDLVFNQTGLHIYIGTLSNAYNKAVSLMGEKVFSLLRIKTNQTYFFGREFVFDSWIHKFKCHEDYAYFGLLGFIVLCLIGFVLIKSAYDFLRSKTTSVDKYSVFAFVAVSYFCVYSFSGKWHYWAGRHLILMVLAAMPMLLLVMQNKNQSINGKTVFLMIYSMIFLVPTTFMNELKPLVPYYADREGFNSYTPYSVSEFGGIRKLVYNHDSIGLRFLHRPYDEMVYRRFEEVVPEESVIGLLVGSTYWDYPFFGHGLNRKIYRADVKTIVETRFDYVIIDYGLVDTGAFEMPYRYVSYKYEPYQYLGESQLKRKIWLFKPKDD